MEKRTGRNKKRSDFSVQHDFVRRRISSSIPETNTFVEMATNYWSAEAIVCCEIKNCRARE